jgi:hypothetical protein
MATVLDGVSLTMLGDTDEGLRRTEAGIELYRGLTTPPVFWSWILHLRALVHGHAGDPQHGIELMDEAIAIVAAGDVTPPEFHIAMGDLLTRLPVPVLDGAAVAYETAARESVVMGLHTLELQALTRTVALRRAMGVAPDGADALGAAYGWFTEGLDEHDLADARSVLGLDGGRTGM